MFLQVSKTEKFGYGSMVTQVAATSPGIVAIQGTGKTNQLVKQVCEKSTYVHVHFHT